MNIQRYAIGPLLIARTANLLTSFLGIEGRNEGKCTYSVL